jgi:predicted esterase
VSGSAPIRTESIEVRRTALVASLGPEPGPASTARELWYILHGQAMRAVAFLDTARALDDGSRLLIAPEALSRHYIGEVAARDAGVGATWMTREERDSEMRDYVRYLDDLHAHVTRQFGGATPPVTVLGFSQGGAAAVRWVAAGNVRPARLIVWASSLPPEIDYAGNPHLRAPRLTYVAGTKDIYITPKVLEAQHQILSNAKLPFEAVSFQGGHRLDDDALRQLSQR